jgi:hypothetical protein
MLSIQRFRTGEATLKCFSRQFWITQWSSRFTYRNKSVDQVNAHSAWLACQLRWLLGVGSPYRWQESQRLAEKFVSMGRSQSMIKRVALP